MENNTIIICYCTVVYLIMYLMFAKELDSDKMDWKDRCVLLFAPISVPLIIIWALIIVIFEP